MNLELLIKGCVIGFSIAAPVGPIGVLCIRRTLADGRLSGLVSGLGAATADAVYGMVAAFGLTLVTSLLVEQQAWLKLLGGLFLIYLGFRTARSPISERPASVQGSGLLGNYAATFGLTLTNPATILSSVAIFAGLGAGETVGAAAPLWMVAGVFLGSAAWWLTLSTGVSLLRARFTPTRLRWVNRASGIILITFGVLAIASTLSI